MIEMTSYLSNYREEIPAWIENYLRGETITFKDIMSSRVGYYPGSGNDGNLMEVGNKSHSVHSFLYVDYMLKREVLEERLDTIRGYHQIGKIEWTEEDFLPNGWYHLDICDSRTNPDSHRYGRQDEQPYCFSLFLERDEDKDDTWGAKNFVVTFLFLDGISAYFQLFVKEYAKAPWLFLLQDHGFGENYSRFDRKGILCEIICDNSVYPKFVICADNTEIWPGYVKVNDVLPVFGGMHHNRRELYKLIEF